MDDMKLAGLMLAPVFVTFALAVVTALATVAIQEAVRRAKK